MNASQSSLVPLPRIAIVGAGPGGLLCARVLQRRGLSVTVYDLDTSLTARHEGGSLDLHADSGQLAMAEAGLLQEFLERARIEGQAQRRYSASGLLEAEFLPNPDERGAPEIDRGTLRHLLAESLNPGTIQWGHKLHAVLPLGDGSHRLTFANGETAETDLLIGADGAWSKVRPLLSSAQPQHTGVVFLTVRYDDVETHHPEIARLVGDGLMVVKGPDGDATGRSIWAQRSGNGSVTGYFTFRADPDWAEQIGLTLTDRAAVVAWLQEQYQSWSPLFMPLLTETDVGFVNRPIVALPAPLTWDRVKGVTLLGDAAHVMPPLGQGVNLALQDAADLAVAISEEPNVDRALQRYEERMLPRAGRIATEVNAGFTQLFSAEPGEAPDRTAELAGYRSAVESKR
ncbi:FAD-dependent oxidoreductase [Deinococcus ruber]|uniref:Flavin-dependent monooxygenase n=1 Tax=Deinococcus ruber TaxID=1848197 RepID=A0A918F9B1_9DEIO|nr:NAD(P)/FAD-dependent oxidoreductase [Deinococcus ruber]GGR21278.1 FAD-dependent oxidoreductase [Deinococcus ruber]